MCRCVSIMSEVTAREFVPYRPDIMPDWIKMRMQHFKMDKFVNSWPQQAVLKNEPVYWQRKRDGCLLVYYVDMAGNVQWQTKTTQWFKVAEPASRFAKMLQRTRLPEAEKNTEWLRKAPTFNGLLICEIVLNDENTGRDDLWALLELQNVAPYVPAMPAPPFKWKIVIYEFRNGSREKLQPLNSLQRALAFVHPDVKFSRQLPNNIRRTQSVAIELVECGLFAREDPLEEKVGNLITHGCAFLHNRPWEGLILYKDLRGKHLKFKPEYFGDCGRAVCLRLLVAYSYEEGLAPRMLGVGYINANGTPVVSNLVYLPLVINIRPWTANFTDTGHYKLVGSVADTGRKRLLNAVHDKLRRNPRPVPSGTRAFELTGHVQREIRELELQGTLPAYMGEPVFKYVGHYGLSVSGNANCVFKSNSYHLQALIVRKLASEDEDEWVEDDFQTYCDLLKFNEAGRKRPIGSVGNVLRLDIDQAQVRLVKVEALSVVRQAAPEAQVVVTAPEAQAAAVAAPPIAAAPEAQTTAVVPAALNVVEEPVVEEVEGTVWEQSVRPSLDDVNDELIENLAEQGRAASESEVHELAVHDEQETQENVVSEQVVREAVVHDEQETQGYVASEQETQGDAEGGPMTTHGAASEQEASILRALSRQQAPPQLYMVEQYNEPCDLSIPRDTYHVQVRNDFHTYDSKIEAYLTSDGEPWMLTNVFMVTLSNQTFKITRCFETVNPNENYFIVFYNSTINSIEQQWGWKTLTISNEERSQLIVRLKSTQEEVLTFRFFRSFLPVQTFFLYYPGDGVMHIEQGRRCHLGANVFLVVRNDGLVYVDASQAHYTFVCVEFSRSSVMRGLYQYKQAAFQFDSERHFKLETTREIIHYTYSCLLM